MSNLGLGRVHLSVSPRTCLSLDSPACLSRTRTVPAEEQLASSRCLSVFDSGVRSSMTQGKCRARLERETSGIVKFVFAYLHHSARERNTSPDFCVNRCARLNGHCATLLPSWDASHFRHFAKLDFCAELDPTKCRVLLQS